MDVELWKRAYCKSWEKQYLVHLGFRPGHINIGIRQSGIMGKSFGFLQKKRTDRLAEAELASGLVLY